MKFIAIISIFLFSIIFITSLTLKKKDFFFFAGIEMIFLGFFIGPNSGNIITVGMQDQLKPLLYLGLGWIGLFYGMQFKWITLRRTPWSSYALVIVHSLLILISFYVVWRVLLPVFGYHTNMDIWIIATMSAVSSPTAIAYFQTKYKIDSENLYWGRFIPSIDDIIPLLCIGMLLSYSAHSSIPSSGVLFFLERTGIILGISVIFGFLFYYLIQSASNRNEIFLYTLGMIILVSGISFYLNLSPLLICFFIGSGFTQVSRRSEIIFSVFSKVEHSFYLFFLLLVGVGFKPLIDGIILPLLLLVFIHAFIKIYSIKIFSVYYNSKNKPSSELGWGLLAQGSMAVAFLVNYREMTPGEHTGWIFSLLLYGMMINEILSHLGLKRLEKLL